MTNIILRNQDQVVPANPLLPSKAKLIVKEKPSSPTNVSVTNAGVFGVRNFCRSDEVDDVGRDFMLDGRLACVSKA